MKIISRISEMQRAADEAREAGRRIALVPTMGALHEGHLALVNAARSRADVLIVSVFVNPMQFGPGEDFEHYPRTMRADLERLRSVAGGVEIIFAPGEPEMYPDGAATWVEVPELTEHLCGFYRPGHFRGVTTIVAKLFLACKPHAAVFGLKDAQQFLVLKQMVRGLNFDVEIVGVPTVREPDGLAMSSRNAFLSPEERRQAVVLSRAVFHAAERIRQGERNVERLRSDMMRIFRKASDARVQYAEIVDQERIQPLEELHPGQDVLVAVAVFFGRTRLIDNAFVRV